jgi:ribosomal protein S18 acetylase RimI-like enzyme
MFLFIIIADYHLLKMTFRSIKLSKITSTEINSLLHISIKTFFDTFSHLNSEANMQAYLNSNLTEQKLTKEFNTLGSEFYFVLVDEKPAGYLKINTGSSQTELQEKTGIEIERIYVLQEYQGKKIGQFLLDNSIKLAQEKHKSYLWLGVWDNNSKAIAFYKKNGFIQFDSHTFKLGDEIQTDVMMKLNIL